MSNFNATVSGCQAAPADDATAALVAGTGRAGDVLRDIDAKGQQRPWVQHKIEAHILAAAYAVNGNAAKAERVETCADALHFTREPAGQDGRAGALHLRLAQFCRVRLCPVCQWRRSLKLFGQTSEIVRWCNEQRPAGFGWVMLTLTQRNIDAADLGNELTLINRAWQRLMQRAEVKAAVVGSMRANEVTHNPSNDTYHPHIHAILCVNRSYFNSRDYISQRRWAQLWAEANRLDYNPIVDIRRCYGSAGEAVAEVAKYAAKPGDYINPSDVDSMTDIVQVLDAALANRRFVAWGGLMAAGHKALNLDDVETGDLVHTDELNAADAAHQLLSFDWVPGARIYYRRSKHVET